jgi:hypothetical protein
VQPRAMIPWRLCPRRPRVELPHPYEAAVDLRRTGPSRRSATPRNSLVGNIVFSARSSDIRHSIIAGRLVMKDHELLTLDEERILWEAERRAFSMLGRAQGTALREYHG